MLHVDARLQFAFLQSAFCLILQIQSVILLFIYRVVLQMPNGS